LLSYFTTYAHYELHKSLYGNHCCLVVLPASGLIHNVCGTVMKITAIWYGRLKNNLLYVMWPEKQQNCSPLIYMVIQGFMLILGV